MCPGTSCVNHSFRYPLLVKMSHFFQKVKVFQQGGASAACLERILIIGYFYSEVGGKGLSHAVVAHGIQVFDFFRGVFRHFHGAGGGRFRVGRSGFGRRLDQFRINGVRIMGFRLFPVRERGEPVLHLLGLFFHWLVSEGIEFSYE